jgi:hypothetical protein
MTGATPANVVSYDSAASAPSSIAMSYVFISHRSTDKPRLRQFVLRLVDRGVPTWIDNPEQFNVDLPKGEARVDAAMLTGRITPSADWPVEIDIALLRADAIVLFWSVNWQSERAVLAREHGVALARHRAGSAVYIPVFLDDPSILARELLEYRVQAGDNVQAFNVAMYGQAQWTALVDAVQQACRRTNRESSEVVGKWQTVLAATRTEEMSARLLKQFPEGPAVDFYRITTSIQRAFANGTDSFTGPELVNIASRLVIAAIGYPPSSLQAYVISPADLPVAERGLGAYWAHVFRHACLLGPRMVSALLLAAPPPLLAGVRTEVSNRLEFLERVS